MLVAVGSNPAAPTNLNIANIAGSLLARLADLALNPIVKIENGVNQNPTIETLTKIAKALEVGVDDLIK